MDIAAGGEVVATRWVPKAAGPVAGGVLALESRSTPSRRHPLSASQGDVAGGEGLGVAFDIGTTTVVGRLYDRGTGECLASASRPNPQAQFGADVISRIAACTKGHLGALTGLVRGTVDAMARDMLAAAGVPDAQPAFTFACGNTVMEHLFAGVDPTPIGLAPFTPPYRADFPCESDALALAPCVAGYVGGDIVCDLLALDLGFLPEDAAPALMMDLGTNGEVALAAPGRIVTCATAAGPVFEGAQISCGMPAYEGAVTAVRREPDGSLAIRVVGGLPAEEATGICGSGLVDAIALMLREGVIDAGGRWADASVPAAERRFAITPRVAITQKDVRAFQLAKAAIAGGVRTLLAAAGIPAADVGEVLIAGGLGTHLDLDNARTAGLIPAEFTCPARAVGNTAIEGAALALLNPDAAAFARTLAATCGYVELSGNADFNAKYLASMDF